jgi:ADP-heptose:LPS heptosyltransferase
MTQVYFAKTSEEANAIEKAQEKESLNSLLLKFLITIWLLIANPLLWFIQRILFKNTGIPDEELKNIVIYTVGTLGDNVLLLPAIAGIKRRFSNATLTAVTNCDGFSDRPAKEILGASPSIDRLITLPTHPVQRHGLKIIVNFPEIRKPNCDLFVNLSPFGNRGWIGAVIREMIFAKWLGAKWAVGFKMSTFSRKGIFNTVQHHFVKNEARRPREILREMGIQPVENEDLLASDLNAKKKVQNIISQYLKGSQPLVVLNPGAKLKASHWPAERFGKVAEWITENYNALVVVNGTVSEKELCDEVVSGSGGTAISLAGELTIQELIELLRMSNLCVTNNTGPMTLSAMVGTPTVVIVGTRFSPSFYIPLSKSMVSVFSFSDNSSYSYDDAGDTSEDLKQIKVEYVKMAIQKVISQPTNKDRYNGS